MASNDCALVRSGVLMRLWSSSLEPALQWTRCRAMSRRGSSKYIYGVTAAALRTSNDGKLRGNGERWRWRKTRHPRSRILSPREVEPRSVRSCTKPLLLLPPTGGGAAENTWAGARVFAISSARRRQRRIAPADGPSPYRFLLSTSHLAR